MKNDLIFGKQETERIVGCDVTDDLITLFTEQPNGMVETKYQKNQFWLLSPNKLDSSFSRLKGDQYYKYIKYYDVRSDFESERRRFYKLDVWSIWDAKEAAMVKDGFTYFKGMKVEDVSVLAFDIETTGLEQNSDSKVLLIANTFKKQGKITRKLFCYNDYGCEAELFDDWCNWVREINPSVLCGHNIVVYDLPYLDFCARKAGTGLKLGRDTSDITFANKESQFRKDGSQSYSYRKINIFGREIIDTFFLAIKYDIKREYESYALKQIIKQEGLEVPNRQFYDASKIKDNYKDPTEWAKIIRYAENDGDDALELYSLMIAPFFYLAQSIPKSFQSIIETASGSQINSFLIRSYLQQGYSLPKATDTYHFEGGISFGNPGLYKDVYKIDISSLYPSIMLTYKIEDKRKDPLGHFQQMVKYFTEERLRNKKLGKETGDRHYKDLEQAEKICINSAYGFLAAPGLLFNAPVAAERITSKGREILNKAVEWAKELGFVVLNADTDSISITDGEFLNKEDRQRVLRELNALFPEGISWEDDGYYKKVLITKAKNYVLDHENGKRTIKGSALKASMKQPRLREFIKDAINYLLTDRQGELVALYHNYVKEILNIKDIRPWSSKKTVTKSVLNPERTNEQKVLDAIGDEDVQEGDKIHCFFDIDNNLQLANNWSGDHSVPKLLESLYKSIVIFENVLDKKQFINYSLKTKRKLLEQI